jgi:hypothetical protein
MQIHIAEKSPRLPCYTRRVEERATDRQGNPVVTFIRTQDIGNSRYIVGAFERRVGTRDYHDLDLGDPILRNFLMAYASSPFVAHEEGDDGNLITLFITPTFEELRTSAPPTEAEMMYLFPEQESHSQSG